MDNTRESIDEEIKKEVHELVESRKPIGRLAAAFFVVALMTSLIVYVWQQFRVLNLEREIADLNQRIDYYQILNNDPGTKIYVNEKSKYELIIPGNWIVVSESEDLGTGKEHRTTLRSVDFLEYIFADDAIHFTDINKGMRVRIWVQEPSSIKSMAEMIAFWKLGREGHIQESETVVQVGGEQALMHTLRDYRNGKLRDFHILHGNKWIDVVFSYEADDPVLEGTLDSIMRSFKFTD